MNDQSRSNLNKPTDGAAVSLGPQRRVTLEWAQTLTRHALDKPRTFRLLADVEFRQDPLPND